MANYNDFQLIDLSFIDEILGHEGKGRKGCGSSVLFKCLHPVFLGYASSIRHLVKKLKHDLKLAEVIGLEVNDGKVKVPHRTTFSKFISGKLKSKPMGFTLVFRRFAVQLIKVGVIKGKEIVVDSTSFRAWCRPPRKGRREGGYGLSGG